MSRVAKNPIVLPQGVDVALSAEKISVKGPLGSISMAANPAVKVEKEGSALVCKPVEGAENANRVYGNPITCPMARAYSGLKPTTPFLSRKLSRGGGRCFA